MQPSLFIIKSDPTGETYRKNFAAHWNFHRLLSHDQESLAALASKIQEAESGHAVNSQDRQRVLFRIEQCLLLCQEDFRAALKNTRRSREILCRLRAAELERFDESSHSSETA